MLELKLRQLGPNPTSTFTKYRYALLANTLKIGSTSPYTIYRNKNGDDGDDNLVNVANFNYSNEAVSGIDANYSKNKWLLDKSDLGLIVDDNGNELSELPSMTFLGNGNLLHSTSNDKPIDASNSKTLSQLIGRLYGGIIKGDLWCDGTYQSGHPDSMFNSETDGLNTVYFLNDTYKSNEIKREKDKEHTVYELLNNRLETPIDMILDAGYIGEIKKLLWDFVDPDADFDNRSDIVLILDQYYHKDDNNFVKIPESFEGISIYAVGQNVAIYDQYCSVNSVLDNGVSIFVTPSYFLSRLIPYNDQQYGIQFPTAGLRRGLLADATYLSKNPIPSEKQNLFESRINYIEKTSREYSFQSQRTHDGSSEVEYTALSFLNNVRAFHKMQKELERLGREYLFEFNDSITLANLSSVLNRYMTQWVSNRTLSSAIVDVRKNSYSDEAVDITMSVRFTGTIEVISVDITIE